MSDILSRGNLFPEALIPNLVNLVKGHSAVAALANQTPIAFNGQKEFTFTKKDTALVRLRVEF